MRRNTCFLNQFIFNFLYIYVFRVCSLLLIQSSVKDGLTLPLNVTNARLHWKICRSWSNTLKFTYEHIGRKDPCTMVHFFMWRIFIMIDFVFFRNHLGFTKFDLYVLLIISDRMIELVLVRHGETEANKTHTIQVERTK